MSVRGQLQLKVAENAKMLFDCLRGPHPEHDVMRKPLLDCCTVLATEEYFGSDPTTADNMAQKAAEIGPGSRSMFNYSVSSNPDPGYAYRQPSNIGSVIFFATYPLPSDIHMTEDGKTLSPERKKHWDYWRQTQTPVAQFRQRIKSGTGVGGYDSRLLATARIFYQEALALHRKSVFNPVLRLYENESVESVSFRLLDQIYSCPTKQEYTDQGAFAQPSIGFYQQELPNTVGRALGRHQLR